VIFKVISMAKKKKKEIRAERVFTIPLRSSFVGTGRITRTNKSVNAVRNFVARHLHSTDVKISQKLNQALWVGGAKNPPGKIRVKASVDSEGLASVKLPGEITLEEEKKKFLEKKKGGEKGKAGKEEGSEKEAGKEGAEKADKVEKAKEEPANDKKAEEKKEGEKEDKEDKAKEEKKE
jgi:large subunit ribosomal protein L31e